MTTPARLKSRRRIAALNFLSNISLDGSHRDTKYSIFLKRGLDFLSDSEDRDGNGDGLHRYNSKTGKNKSQGDGSSKTRRSMSEVAKSRVETFSDVKVAAKSSRRPRLFQSYSISESSTDVVDHTGAVTFASRARHRSSSSHSSTSSLSSGWRTSKGCSTPTGGLVNFLNAFRKSKRKEPRLVVLASHKAPVVVFSTIPYERGRRSGPEGHRKFSLSMLQEDTEVPTLAVAIDEGQASLNPIICSLPEGHKELSYKELLVPAKVSTSATKTKETAESFPCELQTPVSSLSTPELDESATAYNPQLLDDPDMRSEKHRTVMCFTSYLTSVLDYARPSEVKKELNEKFREKFPSIQLTLSKLRSLKKDLLKIADKCGVDRWTVAQAYVYFEKVILMGYINKANRRLCAGGAFILAAKLNDIKGEELTKLIEETEDMFKLHRKELIAHEFGVLVALQFTLLIPDCEIAPHHQRITNTAYS